VTSDRKVQANRANARRSTGARTSHGRDRSAKNAFRHGLSLPVHLDPEWSDEVETLARQIAGPGANAELQELARHIADAQVELCRVRHARHQFLSHALNDPYYDSRKGMRGKAAVLRDLLKRNAPEISMDDLERVVTTPQGPLKFATILAQETKKLLAMNRYERRALSRRKFAIRAFDAVRPGANKSLMTTPIKKNSGSDI